MGKIGERSLKGSFVVPALESAPPLTFRPWTDYEIGVLKEYYGRRDTRLIAKVLNRSFESVRCKASALGLKAFMK